MYKTYYKRNLPHYQHPGYTFFVTFRLTDSIPLKVLLKLREESEAELKRVAGYANSAKRNEMYKSYQSKNFGKYDSFLDKAQYGPKWLEKAEIAIIVKEALHQYDSTEYELICYSIMPNHVHMIFTPNKIPEGKDYIVTKILQKIKSKTALKANQVLERKGAFWQHESYDHIVRNEDELNRCINYVLYNPVKAGLCEQWEDWKWNYLK
jgi:putative transposase